MSMDEVTMNVGAVGELQNMNVVLNPKSHCGDDKNVPKGSKESNDTIDTIVIDTQGRLAAGTSTNGVNRKIPGHARNSPVVGGGEYANQDVSAAICTGDEDIMMRFLPSFLAMEKIRRGVHPSRATSNAILRITYHYPNFFGGIVTLNKLGEYEAACNEEDIFPYTIVSPTLSPRVLSVPCSNLQYYKNTYQIFQ
ncbi:N(4)-(Beta-N-acetylglucosaminyl)-L-asparaginase [Trachymyrmex cornetzi]|uniref:N(4)-(Beta-N-acetylglucosaminyl)-L-asparaginase n=1 Tax=Trachymyrmex cornetzi TaxID=471704 RepID=A0A195EHL7_9HYME|nr:N(4)-(Beta-N-acetylglucosaminyl)-L-asparaginase [Trachymyrmex cornetzi]